MEEDKAAAYYNELSKKGEGAAKFKQGLGFSSSSNSNPFSSKSKNNSSLSNFIRASSNPNHNDDSVSGKIDGRGSSSFASNGDCRELDTRTRDRVIDSVRCKLSRKGGDERGRDNERESRERRRRRRSRSRSRSRSRNYSPDSRVSRDRDRESRHYHKEKDRYRDRERDKYRDKDERNRDVDRDKRVDYSHLIKGYSQMTPAEKVKAKMKLQLKQTSAKDEAIGMSSGWERFDFNKDAPLDDEEEEETEAADDDSSVVKSIGRSFRFSAVEARREEDVRAAHDEAMFGRAPQTKELVSECEEVESHTLIDNSENDVSSTALMSNTVLSKQQGSWRDRARKSRNEPAK